MMKRKTIALLLAACLLLPCLLLAGCAAGEEKQVLRVYNWEDYISDTDEDGYVDLIAKFEEENPGVTVEYSTFGTNENMYNELKINAAGYDLVCPSDYMIMKMIAEDMVEEFSEDFLQNSSYAKYASPYIRELFEKNGWEKYAVAYMWGTMGYVYNPAAGKDITEDLSSWAGIWGDAYKGKSTIKDSVRDSYFLGVAYVCREELSALAKQYAAGTLGREEYNAAVTQIMNRTDEETIDAVKDALIDLKDNLYGFEVDSGKQDIVTGKISINFAWSGDAITSMNEAEEPIYDEETGEVINEGVSLKYIVPDECTNIWFDGWVMPKGANRELAEKFLDFLSRPENAAANMNYIGYTSAVAGDEVFEQMVDWYDESADPENRGTDENGEALLPYYLNYFFGGTGEYDDYVIYISEESENRQLSAQYPTEEVLARSAVMQYFDNEVNAKVNEMWEEVKGLPIPLWAYIVIACIAAGGVVIGLSYLYKGKRSESKPKKGYHAVKRG